MKIVEATGDSVFAGPPTPTLDKRSAVTLDEAWAEALAALPPENWTLNLSTGDFGRRDIYTATASYSYSLRHYRENVGKARYAPYVTEQANDPITALRRLTTRLRDDVPPYDDR